MVYIIAIDINLETELLEEPLGLSRLVLSLQGLSQLLAQLLLNSGILQSLTRNITLFQLKAITSRHQMGIIDQLDKRLNTATLGNLLGIHIG